MPPNPIHIVKWTFPAFALIIGLLWYKRRRVDRADPGGINKRSCEDRTLDGEANSSAPEGNSILRDSGIHSDESFTSNLPSQSMSSEPICSPRKISENLDIPTRKAQHEIPSESSSLGSQAWYKDVEPVPNTMEIQLGSNPQISNFEMVARSRCGSSFDAVGEVAEEKIMVKLQEAIEEEEQRAVPSNMSQEVKEESSVCEDKVENERKEEQCTYVKGNEVPDNLPENDGNTPAQALSERDSANHSPVSGALEGSITDEARSEGSTDSGKGGSINGHTKDTPVPIIYEFSIPQHLVGKLIGCRGSFLQSVRNKANVHIGVKRHPTSRDQKICTIEGSSSGIDLALELIRQKFPEKKYPQVTLEQLPAKMLEEVPWVTPLMQLSLVDGVNNDVVICHIVKPNRLFVQLPTHPTYPSLRILDANMTQLYDTLDSPPVPEELHKGMLVVAKWFDRWVRVYVELPDPLGEQNLVRLVDHGGYWLISSANMRMIRSDYLTLPFQAIEIFLANIQPKDGKWKQEACDVVIQMCSGIVGQAQIEGYINDNTYVNLYLNIQNYGVISLADELVARGYAETVPLERIVPPEAVPTF